jgi:LysM repeat protein
MAMKSHLSRFAALMNRIFIAGLGCLCLAGCKGDPPKFTAPAPPAKPMVEVAAGDNLEAIAAEAYGHARFSLLVAEHNHVKDETKLQVGQKIATPGIVEMFRSAGLDGQVENAVSALAWAVADYHRALPGYGEARRKLGKGEAGRIDLPEEHALRLNKIGDAVEFAINDIKERSKNSGNVPEKSLAQFREALRHLRELASGQVDGFFYDVDLVDQRLAHGLTNLYVWTTETHR